jgi:hypothetical protein
MVVRRIARLGGHNLKGEVFVGRQEQALVDKDLNGLLCIRWV